MHLHGIRRIGDLAHWVDADLLQHFGRWGVALGALSRGMDHTEIEPTRQRQSASHEHTFSQDVADRTVLENTIRRQALAVSRRLSAAGEQGKVVRLKLR